MKKKIVRQSDLIVSLERSEVRNSHELDGLKSKIREQEEIIRGLRKSHQKLDEVWEPEPRSESELEDDVREGRRGRGRGLNDKWHNEDY